LKKIIIGISNNPESPWMAAIQSVVDQNCQFIPAKQDEVQLILQENKSDLILIEASSITSNIGALVSSLEDLSPKTPIIVVTHSPTWQNARDIFKAGAADYVRSTLNKKELATFLSNALR